VTPAQSARRLMSGDRMTTAPLPTRRQITARALLVGKQFDLSTLRPGERVLAHPVPITVGDGGIAMLFRYGAIVLFDVPEGDAAPLIDSLQAVIVEPIARHETENLQIVADPQAREGFEDGSLILRDAGTEQLQTVAEVLAKSVLLGEYETTVGTTFDQIAPMAAEMKRRGTAPRNARALARYIGESLLGLHRVVGLAQVGEKPDILWEQPALESLYLRLAHEFELGERQLALERKLDLISRTVETLLDLLQAKRTLRVEWYIVILIVVEILLTLYELFLRGH
jgi:uncharacterized Rmd1/YagE family protein